jgi:multicomponent Na+:H+ antiporter subunit B
MMSDDLNDRNQNQDLNQNQNQDLNRNQNQDLNQNQSRKGQGYEPGVVIELVSRMMCPFIIMFGAYLIMHGHLTPGGGFQGGVVIAAAFILFALVFGRTEGRSAAPSFSLKCLASGGIYLYIGAGLAGVLLGYHFLANKVAGIFPCGMMGALFSAGTIFWIDIGVGLAVASIFTELFFAFLEEERDDAYLRRKKESEDLEDLEESEESEDLEESEELGELGELGDWEDLELEDKEDKTGLPHKRRWSDVD